MVCARPWQGSPGQGGAMSGVRPCYGLPTHRCCQWFSHVLCFLERACGLCVCGGVTCREGMGHCEGVRVIYCEGVGEAEV
eukprot:353939-Chlamydomonas_euryale.AAC.21